MCWGIHWATSAPGALADIQWQAKVAAYAATFPNRDRFVLGTPFYGFDWPAGGGAQHRATPYGHAAVLGLAATFGATPIWDPASAEAHFSYTDRAGVGHDVWYTTAQSIASRVQLAADKGLGGIGFWRLGQEDQGVWDTPLLAPGTPWPNAGA